jgi:hypothetical protein
VGSGESERDEKKKEGKTERAGKIAVTDTRTSLATHVRTCARKALLMGNIKISWAFLCGHFVRPFLDLRGQWRQGYASSPLEI